MIFSIFSSGYTVVQAIIIAVCYIVFIVISMTLHEYAHAYVAYKCGDSTAKYNGRTTLNPLAHFDLVGFVMLLLIGFGFAKAVPVNFSNLRKRRYLFAVAVAGVTVNLILAFILSFFAALIGRAYESSGSDLAGVFEYAFYLGAVLNISLFVFNLLPIYPLDGFRVVESFASDNNRYVRFMRRYGFMVLVALLAWSFVLGFVMQYFPNSANILQYFDIIGFLVGNASGYILQGLLMLWQAAGVFTLNIG